jgi:uncharacterized membrane protein
MPLWLILALCCITSWGIWGFLAKLVTAKGMHPVALSAVSSLTTALTAWIAFFFLAGAPWDKTYGHIPFALIVGILGSVGAITFFLALHHGRASLVVPLSALTPPLPYSSASFSWENVPLLCKVWELFWPCSPRYCWDCKSSLRKMQRLRLLVFCR